MKKILFVTTRNPFSGRYSGDVIRSLKIINLLKKKFELHIICLKDKSEKNNEKNLISFNYPNLFLKFIYCLISFFKFQPLQFGLFFSRDLKIYIEDNADKYDYLFFYHIRSSQYLPKNYYGKTIIEMGDLYSENYYQTYEYLNFLNPLKFIYYLESYLVKKIENKILNDFDKIILFSKKEADRIDKKFKNKIIQINESIDKIKNKYVFSKDNFRILFVGNLNYLPNLLACKYFIKNIFPKLKLEFPLIKFCMIGSINKFNRFFLKNNSSIETLGAKKDLSKYIKNSICGLANLEIATGVQGKVLTYMSWGLPVICSKKVAQNIGLNVLSYNNDKDLIKKFSNLKTNKQKCNQLSKNSLKFSKSLNWKKVGLKYLKLFNF